MPMGILLVKCDGMGGRRGYWSLHNLQSPTLQYTVVLAQHCTTKQYGVMHCTLQSVHLVISLLFPWN